MTKPNSYRSRSGRTLTAEEIGALADEVERTEYNVEDLKTRKWGRPPMGSGAAEVVPVRIDPELKAAIDARAAVDDVSASEIIREAIRRFLDVAWAAGIPRSIPRTVDDLTAPRDAM